MPSGESEHRPAAASSLAAVPAPLLRHGPVSGPWRQPSPPCLQCRSLQMMLMEAGGSGLAVNPVRTAEALDYLRRSWRLEGGRQTETTASTTFWWGQRHANIWPTNRYSRAERRGGAAGCAAPVAGFLGLPERWFRAEAILNPRGKHRPIRFQHRRGFDHQGRVEEYL